MGNTMGAFNRIKTLMFHPRAEWGAIVCGMPDPAMMLRNFFQPRSLLVTGMRF
jgi:hypothetical protein